MTLTTTTGTAAKAARHRLRSFHFNSDAQAITALDRNHKFIINLGGKGSGKTATHPLWAAERGTWDTSQRHGIFTNTDRQLQNAVLPELYKFFPKGLLADHGHKPPRAWVREWEKAGIEIPTIADYRGVFYTRAGLHATLGTLSTSRSYRQYESIEFATLRVEEITGIPFAALDMILSRLRCGSGQECDVEFGHRHQAWLFGNPPVGPHPWLFDWLDRLEEGAKQLYHADETCPGCNFITKTGRAIPREHGPTLKHRQWPLLRRGIGNTRLVQSKTSDNRSNLSAGYEDDLAMNFDRKTALAWLEGELVRETSAGCYEAFSDLNVRPVKYDPNREIYVCVDINVDPRVAVLAHPLTKGEYPPEWEMPGLEQIGAFGEFFSVGQMSDEKFIEEICAGGRGYGDAGYQDDILRGLPENWKGLSRHAGRIVFYGDATGNARNSADYDCGSHWTIMQNALTRILGAGKYGVCVPGKTNKDAHLRINAVNAKLKNHRGIPSLSIDERCRHTIKDCEQVVWDDKNGGTAEREWRYGAEMLRTHCMAALGYMILQKWPLGRSVSDDGLPDFSTMNPAGIEPPMMR